MTYILETNQGADHSKRSREKNSFTNDDCRNKKSYQSICGKMVAKIKKTQSLSRSLNYNEKKVQLGVAKCIHAVNYPKDLEALNFYDKLQRLECQAVLNERVKASSVHISLNFHESDTLNTEKLFAIAETYMKGISFENQPYLVYCPGKKEILR